MKEGFNNSKKQDVPPPIEVIEHVYNELEAEKERRKSLTEDVFGSPGLTETIKRLQDERSNETLQ